MLWRVGLAAVAVGRSVLGQSVAGRFCGGSLAVVVVVGATAGRGGRADGSGWSVVQGAPGVRGGGAAGRGRR